MTILPHDPPADFADQLRAAILEAEAHAQVNGTREARFYAMGLRVAAGLYGMVEGVDPDTRARRLAAPALCGATNHHPCAINAGLLGGQHRCEKEPHPDDRHRCVCGAEYVTQKAQGGELTGDLIPRWNGRHGTSGGVALTPEVLADLADEAERGYDTQQLQEFHSCGVSGPDHRHADQLAAVRCSRSRRTQ